MALSGIADKFLRISEWIMFFLLVNLIWLLFNFPVVYLGVSMLFVQTTEELQSIIIWVLVLLPIIFMPATTAMFAVVRRKIAGTYEGRLVYFFWKYYKENFKRSMLGSLVIIPIWSLWLINFLLSGIQMGTAAFYMYIIATCFLLSFTNYFLSDTVHFSLKLFSSLKKAFIMSVAYSHYTIGLAITCFLFTAIIYYIHPLLLILFSGSTIAFLYFWGYYRIFLNAQAKEESTNV